MKISVRLNEDLGGRLRKIAEAEGMSLSEVIRRAADLYWERHAGSSLELRLVDVLGKVKSRGGRARRTGASLRKALRRRDSRRRWYAGHTDLDSDMKKVEISRTDIGFREN